ncbi:SLA class II histocompatibility antigen, DQ haplotype D alpha chain, partial [Myotis brandtii]
SGQYTHEFDGEEEFYADLSKKETVCWLPGFSEFKYFDTRNALRNMAMLKYNLHLLIERSNYKAAPNKPEIPAPMSELTETVVCALGLAVGLVGIVTGTVFIIQGLRPGGVSRQQGPL